MLKKLLLFILVSFNLYATTAHYYWLPKIFNAPNYQMSFEDLVTASKNKSNVKDVLASLVKKYPELKTTFTLVYNSQSLQLASKKEPRIIFFTPNGLFFSIATDKTSDRIEVIEFNSQKLKFDFHEISFNGNTSKVQRDAKSCFACHADKPIWGSYHTWKGVYGSSDDYTFKDRMNQESLIEREELKKIIETNLNDYLKLIELDKSDFFLENYGAPSQIFSPLRRNSYLLFHLGYYNLLTQNPTSNNLSFLNPTKYFNFGGDYVEALAAKTKSLGLEDNQNYLYVEADGNYPKDLNIPSDKKADYDHYFSENKKLTEKHFKSPLAKCLACHTEGSNPKAPVIPFNNTQAMKELMKNTDLAQNILRRIDPSQHGSDLQMPPDETISERESQSIVDYLEFFKGNKNNE